MIRAVIDANVFISAVISPKGNPAKILGAWKADKFQLILSAAILQEIGRVLQYPKIARRHRWSREEIQTFVDDLAHLATMTPGKIHLRVIPEDPSDDAYIECAVEGEAEYLVSGDKHLLDLGTYGSVTILTSRAFLGIL